MKRNRGRAVEKSFFSLVRRILCYTMSRRHKPLELSEKKDYISELPEDILFQLISLLPLKEAVRTSVLSKSWKSIWTTHKDIVCEITNILGLSNDESRYLSPLIRPERRNKFIKRVDQIMQQRHSSGTQMNSVLIKYPLTREDENHITSWISNAVMMGVETIDLDFTGCESDFGSEYYTFPFSVLAAPGKECTVKYLRLSSCCFQPLSVSSSLASIVTVELENVDYTNEQLDVLLCNCLFLERMVLRSRQILGEFKLMSKSSRFKYLAFKDCSKLNTIELYAENLEIVEYTGKGVRFSFIHVPKLAEVYLSFYGESSRVEESARYALCQIANSGNLPRLETLNIPLYQGTMLPEEVSALSNIKYLVLNVSRCYSDDELHWLGYILKAFPLLNKLILTDFIPSSPKQLSDTSDTQLPKFIHENLRELEMNGYHGNRRQLQLVKYLVDNAVNLDLLVISALKKVYKGSNNWHRAESTRPGTDTILPELSSRKIKELRSIVAKADIRCSIVSKADIHSVFHI